MLALPLSPSIWRLYAMGPACFTPAWMAHGVHPAACLAGFALVAPFAVVFGPISHDEEDAPGELPEVLLTAFLLATVFTVLSAIVRRDRRQGS
jgi:hypothetical protein